MIESKRILPEIRTCYGSLQSFQRKFDRYGRRDSFSGQSKEEFEVWRRQMKILLRQLLGFDKLEQAPLNPVTEESVVLEGGITREHIRIQVEPDVWMPLYLLIPADAGVASRLFLCPPGHNGAGKYSVAGVSQYQMVEEKITQYHYDYGLQLARMGYVAVCPDCRGFGERRELLSDAADAVLGLKGDCYWLAHMGEPLGIPVAGMLTWDLMRAIDYLELRGQWNVSQVSCLGFSGGGMQAMWLSALDERVRMTVISGYLYGFKDSLLTMNRNCSCNYVPHLWEHLDMGDIVSLISPRPLLVQSCRDDRLNGARGMINVYEQMKTVREAYQLLGAEACLIHEVCEGGHQWHEEHLKEHLDALIKLSRER